jgi:DNA-directed RNA polymerase specialized sigma24 family protein
MADSDSLALEFEAHRAHLRGVAYRVLGSASDAEDAVQEAWLRLSRTDVSGVASLRAWLTTVTGRVALSMLESRGTRREDVRAEPPEPAVAGPRGGAFSPGPVTASLTARADQQRAVVDAFFAAAREAQFASLLQLLDPDVVMRADAVAARMGADESVTGADAVARWISGRAQGAVPATVGGEPGAAWAVKGKVRVAFGFTINGDGRITAIDLIGDPVALPGLDVELAG